VTDEQWVACTDPTAMCRCVENRASERKLILFAVACCRRVWHLMTDPRHAALVEVAEQVADGLATDEDFEAAEEPIRDLWRQLPNYSQVPWEPFHFMTGATRHLQTGGGALYAASYAARGLALQAGPQDSPAWSAARQAEAAEQARLLRDIVPSPIRPFIFDPAWLAGAGRVATELAGDIYRERKFSDLPALASALEAAGCTDEAVLEHCRGPGPHVRGCWVVDALLGREAALRASLLTTADWRACRDTGPLWHVLRAVGSVRRWRLFAVACCRRIAHLMADERSLQAIEVAARHAEGLATDDELNAAHDAAQSAEEVAREAYNEAVVVALPSSPECAPARSRWYAALAARQTACRDPRTPDNAGDEQWQPSNELAAQALADCVYAAAGCDQGLAGWSAVERAAEVADAAELLAQCDLLRELFGGWLGPVGEETTWLPGGLPRGLHRLDRPEVWCRLPGVRPPSLRPEWLAWNDGTALRLARLIDDEGAYHLLPILGDALEDAGCDDGELLRHCRGDGPHLRGCWVVDLLLGKE
jgi:hypothetical protein